MSKHFYRDVKVVKHCKVKGCNVLFRPQRGSVEDRLGLCHTHRHEYYKKWYDKVGRKYEESLTPAQKERYKKTRYATWLKWVEKNKEKRRAQALASYHRNKAKHKDRKHRPTKAVAAPAQRRKS